MAKTTTIAAGVAIFLFGTMMPGDGFKLFGGRALERILDRATASVLRAIAFGFVATSFQRPS